MAGSACIQAGTNSAKATSCLMQAAGSITKAGSFFAKEILPLWDSDFETWSSHLALVIQGNPQAYGLDDAGGNALGTAHGAWNTAFTAFQTAEQAYHAARLAKDQKRADSEALIRQDNAIAQAYPAITDDLLQTAGLPVHQQGRVHAAAVWASLSGPEIELQHRETQKLTVVFREGGGGGESPSRGKPDGVRACEIWVKVGTPAPAEDMRAASQKEQTEQAPAMSGLREKTFL